MHRCILFLSLIFFISCNDKKELTYKDETQTNQTIETGKNDFMEENIHQPEWAKNAIIYEINTRQFSKKGDFKSVTTQLSRLKELGVDLLWLMPIHPIGKENRKGELGSYYSIKDFKKINPEFGNEKDFKILVDSAHSLGMKIVLDWVANHSSFDHKWVKEHLDFYIKDDSGKKPISPIGTDWHDVAQFDYRNPALRDSMIDAMKYWVKKYDIDGFRCDMAELLPIDFWKQTREELDKIKPLFMIAEGEKPELHNYFNLVYGWEFKNIITDIASNRKSFNLITNYISKQKHNPNNLTMYFTTNHDENSWNYIEGEIFGENKFNYVTLTYCLSGIPLIYNGQESGLNKKLKFFDKDPIQWGDYKYAEKYKQLNNLLKKYPVWWNNGKDNSYEILEDTEDIFCFIKNNNNQMIAVLQNYSNSPELIRKISLNTFDLSTNVLTGESNKITDSAIEIPPHSTIILNQHTK